MDNMNLVVITSNDVQQSVEMIAKNTNKSAFFIGLKIMGNGQYTIQNQTMDYVVGIWQSNERFENKIVFKNASTVFIKSFGTKYIFYPS